MYASDHVMMPAVSGNKLRAPELIHPVCDVSSDVGYLESD